MFFQFKTIFFFGITLSVLWQSFYAAQLTPLNSYNSDCSMIMYSIIIITLNFLFYTHTCVINLCLLHVRTPSLHNIFFKISHLISSVNRMFNICLFQSRIFALCNEPHKFVFIASRIRVWFLNLNSMWRGNLFSPWRMLSYHVFETFSP